MWSCHQNMLKTSSIENLFPNQAHLISLLASDHNLFVYGARSSGKKTLIAKYHENVTSSWALSDYDSDGHQKQCAQLMTRRGKNHIDIWLNDTFRNKKNVLKKILNDLSIKLSFDEHGRSCKSSVVLYNVHHLSYAMLDILNAFVSRCLTCRVIMVSDRYYEALAFGCIPYRFNSNTAEYALTYIHTVCRECGLTYDHEQAAYVVDESRNNVTKCVLNYDLWLSNVENVYMNIIHQVASEYLKPNPSFPELRSLYYQLLVNNVHATDIIKDVLKELCIALRDAPSVVMQVVRAASICEHRVVVGERDIYHLDAFGLGVCEIINARSSFE